jgi:hypothetical protein
MHLNNLLFSCLNRTFQRFGYLLFYCGLSLLAFNKASAGQLV